jgi:hypothetical protein
MQATAGGRTRTSGHGGHVYVVWLSFRDGLALLTDLHAFLDRYTASSYPIHLADFLKFRFTCSRLDAWTRGFRLIYWSV